MGRKHSGEGQDDQDDEEEPEPEEEENEGSPDLENWVDYFKRATGVAEDCLKNARLEDWVSGQRRRKWRWAGHTARRFDGRWSHKVLHMRDMGGTRKVGHPATRWRDSIGNFVSANTRFTSSQWITLAQSRDEWHALEDGFVQWSI